MSKRTAIVGLVCFFSCFSSAWAWEGYYVTQSYVAPQNPHDLAVVHGYYPDYFSEDLEPNYWITPEEAGHYILGRGQRSYWPAQSTSVPSTPVIMGKDTTRVLVAPAHTAVTVEFEPSKSPDYTNRPTRINDSLDLPQIIKDHAWVMSRDL